MSNKKTILGGVLSTLLVLSAPNIASAGIPVIDAAAIQQSAQNSLKELAEMAKQLAEAKAQVEQLKATVSAMTGDKGFSEILEQGGIDEEITGSFEDLMEGNISSIAERANEYLDNLPACEQAVDKSLCETASLGSFLQLDFAEKLNNQITSKIERITELSTQATQATDLKGLAEIQANIELEANSIALIQQQADNFERIRKSQAQIAVKQAREAWAQRQWESFGNQQDTLTGGSVGNMADLLE